MDLNRKNLKKLMLLISFGIILFLVLQNIGVVLNGLKIGFALLLPLILGFSLAFILSVPMKFLEEKVFGWFVKKKFKVWQKIHRPVCLLLTLISVVGLILILLFIIIPGIAESFRDLIEKLPAYLGNLQVWTNSLIQNFNDSSSNLFDYQIDWDKVSQSILKFMSNFSLNVVSYTVDFTSSFVSWIYNFVLALFLAIYMLLQKEKVAVQFKKLFFAYLPEAKAQRLVDIGRLSNQTFSRFITGQLTEAVILGCLCFLGMTVFGFPYAPLISVMVAVTALIPMIGAFIGLALGVFLILMISPIKALYFVIFFLILQQFEGNFIYPRVVGNSVGLNGLWVLAAITIGAGFFGFIGILLAVPICSVLYSLLKTEVGERLQERKIPKQKYN